MTPEGTARCLPGKRLALFLCLQSVGHLEFLPKLAQVLVFSAVRYINQGGPVVNYKENQEYQQECGLSSQEAQDEQDEQYSSPNIKDNSLFTVSLDFERLPFVELGLINAGEIGSSKVFNIHWPSLSVAWTLLKTIILFIPKVNPDRRPGSKFLWAEGGVLNIIDALQAEPEDARMRLAGLTGS
jgi:hypothetical protein